jgi:hypothetical protein
MNGGIQSGMKSGPGSEFRNLYAAALFTNWRWLTIPHAVNQAVVPQEHRFLVEQLLALWWNVCMAVYVCPPGAGPSTS